MKSEKLLIKQLRRRIGRLTEQNERLRRRCSMADTADSKNQEIAHHRRESRLIMASSSYPRYVYSTLRQSSAYRGWMRLLTYFRRFRLVSVIIRIATNLITIIETSALLIVAATVFIIALPALLILSLVAAIAVLVSGTRCNRRLSRLLEDKQIFMFFPTADRNVRQGGVLHATLCQLASDPQNAVFAVSPYYVSSNLFGQRGFYFIEKLSHDNVFYIRKYYFFMLRRGVLSKARDRVRYIF